MVPNGWKQQSIGRHIKVRGGFAFKSELFQGEGVPIIRISNIQNGCVSLQDAPCYEESHNLEQFKITHGDVLIAMSGATTGKVGRFYPKPPDGYAYLNQRVGKFEIKDERKTDLDYFHQITQTSRFLHSVVIDSIGGAQPNVSGSEIESIVLNWPPLPEQKKIARILSTWDKAIETVDKLIENSQQQKKALMQQLLTGKKRMPGFSGEWKKVRLGKVCTFKGGFGFKEQYQGVEQGDYPFIKVSDMNLQGNEKYITCSANWISEETRKIIGARAFPKNSIVFAKVGAALLLNRRRILTRDTLIDNNMMAAACSKNAHPEFIYHLLLTIDFAKYVQEGAVPSINQSTLNAIKVHMPPYNEQAEIAKVLNGMEQLTASYEKQGMNLSQQKQALMQQLLTGKRRVNA
jgi:type I restriction enzyme S subunit